MAKKKPLSLGSLKHSLECFKGSLVRAFTNLSYYFYYLWIQANYNKIPSSLVALIVVSGVAVGLNLNYASIEKIPTDFPLPNVDIFTSFELSTVSPYIITALTLSPLGSIDSLLTSVVADNMTKPNTNPIEN